MKVTEWDIQNKLWSHLQYQKKHNFIYPNNASMFCWEADMISVTGSGYIHEYEIKISKSDFKADFKKPKHKIFLGENKSHKHFPSYFWYVTYGFEIDETDIPKYAGWIKMSQRGESKTLCYGEIKKAPKINNYKLTEKMREKIYKNMFWKYWNIRDKERKLLEES